MNAETDQHLREHTRQALEAHLELATQLGALSAGQPLLSARLAHRLGEPELAWALIALSGGLFDAPERELILRERVPEALVERALQEAPRRAKLPDWTETQREMYVRVLAGLLLGEVAPTPAELGGCGPAFPAGLWYFPTLRAQSSWAAGLHLTGADQGDLHRGASSPVARQACASRGRQWGLRRHLHDLGASERLEVLSLEQVMTTLSAAWHWDLPALPQLLARPLLIEGLESLSPERFDVLSSLLSDCVQLFGWCVIVFPQLERSWPHQFQLFPQAGRVPSVAEAQARPPAPALLAHFQPPGTLAELVQQLAEPSGRSLVVLYSRASAGRLAGLLPGSVLLSSSLSRAHLEERMALLAGRRDDPHLTVIATTLPASPVGLFDRVWHISAPLPYLNEAAQLSRGSFGILRLADIVLPTLWMSRAQVTEQLFEQGDPLNDPFLQQTYFERLDTLEGPGGSRWRERRAQGQYASLSSELNMQPDSSVPVLIPFDTEAQEVIARYRQTGRLPRRDLKFAAWMTPTEVQRAVKAGEASLVGWAAVWHGRYDPEYGLAWRYLSTPSE